MPDETVARFVFPRLDVGPYRSDSSYRDSISRLLEEGVGGFVVFDGEIDDVGHVISEIRKQARHPLLMAADCEFGTAMRFRGGREFPRAMGLGASADRSFVEEISYTIACDVAALGIDWNLAPVVDVNVDPGNPIVNVRSFGEHPGLVSEMACAFLRGHRRAGVATCAKHYPGHGDTVVDSHIELASIVGDTDRIETVHLPPFHSLVDAGVDAVMTGHLVSVLFDKGRLPASLSKEAIDRLRFTDSHVGVVITDALDMGALKEFGSSGEIAVRAFIAGNDVLELPEDPLAAISALRSAVASDVITPGMVEGSGRRLDRMMSRISRAKTSYVPVEIGGWKEWGRKTFSTTSGRERRSISDVVLIAESPDTSIVDRLRASIRGLGFDQRDELESADSAIRFTRTGPHSTDQPIPRHTLVITLSLPRGGEGTINLNRTYSIVPEGISWSLITLGSPYIDTERLAASPPLARVDTYSPRHEALSAAFAALEGTDQEP